MNRLLCWFFALTVAMAGTASAQSYYAQEQIAVAATAVGFTSTVINAGLGHPAATSAFCRAETAELRYRIDGTAPTTTAGILLEPGDALSITNPIAMAQFLIIRTTSTSGSLSCSYTNGPSQASIAPNAAVSATISGGNAAASATGSAVPANAGYTGLNIGGNLVGQTGFSVGSARAAGVAIVDGSGAQITSFGGGTQYTNGSAQATPTGTTALGWDGANVRALSTNSSGVLALPTSASTSTKQSDGSQKTQIVDGSGNVIASTSNNLNVQCANCSGSGASAVDEASMTEGTSVFAPAGGYYKSSITALTTGQQGMVALTPTRSFHMSPYDTAGATLVGAAGTAAAGVMTVQGIASMTALTVAQATGSNLHIVCDSGCSSSTAPADEAAFTAGTTSQSPVGGFFQTTATSNALTTGQMGAFQVTAQRALFSNLRNASGTEVGTSGTPLQVSLANTGANTNKLLVTPDSVALPANQSVNVNQVGGSAYALGLATAAASQPIVQAYGALKSGVTAAMTATTSTQTIAAVASNYLYISACSVTNTSTTGTLVNLQDGSGGTTLYTLVAPAAAASSNAGQTMTFPIPLKVPTIGNALYAANVTTSSSVILSCNGFASTVSY